LRDTAIVGHRNYAIEYDIACLPGPCRGAIHQNSAAQQHDGKLRIPLRLLSLVHHGVEVGCGNPLDYDTWAQFGNCGWSYESVLPCFKKSEH